jgi:glycosyltransferase involved in cell wall biosynthesis
MKGHKKKICFVSPQAYLYFNPEAAGTPGGSERQMYLLATGLAKEGEYDVHFIVADHGQDEMEEREGVTVWKSCRTDQPKWRNIHKLRKRLKRVNAHVYILRSPDLGVAVAGFIIKKMMRKKLLYMMASEIETNRGELSQLTGWLSAISMPYLYRNADMLLVQSESQYTALQKHRNIQAHAVFPNIVPLPEKCPEEDKEDILWVGKINDNKRPSVFARLATQNPDEHFVMIGPPSKGDENMAGNMEKIAAKTPNLNYMGAVPHNQVKEYYCKAKLFVTTSRHEGFSNAMAEALSHGVPVLSLNTDPDGILKAYYMGLCVHDDIEMFGTEFQRLINDPVSLKTMSRNARKYIQENHSPELLAKELTKLLTEL